MYKETLTNRLIINIKGIVQGVGFRPFVYNLATSLVLNGWIINNPSGVQIEVEGDKNTLELFISKLQSDVPPLAYIEECNIKEGKVIGYKEFSIKKSQQESTHDAYISPDITVCEDCISEFNNPLDRRYMYPFINCTNCGPRFTITTNIPYDRINTTMYEFNMCEDCKKEYNDPRNRRFHAQPIACPKCGPKLQFIDNNGNNIKLSELRYILKEGKIVAIKGLGGYHLACDALNANSAKDLRIRKIRDGKPFALMCRDIDTVEQYCYINEKEKELLKSRQRPIVLLRRKNSNLPIEYIANDTNTLGIMLPYTPIHYLLFDDDLKIIIMTSGNKGGEPIYYKDDDAISELKDIAHYFLLHNREIYIRTDDSVTSEFNGYEYIIRRSRGYVPFPIDLSFIQDNELDSFPDILSCGGELKNTFCLVKKNKAFISHHVGDLENIETLKSFEDGIEHFKKILSIDPKCIVYDMHPEYLSTKYAKKLEGFEKIECQHHHAHIASCMAENKLNQPVIGVALDGTGYGADGNIWGGEFFSGDYSGFKREAHLAYMPMPGADKCIKEPWRMAYSYIREISDSYYKRYDKYNLIEQQISKRINCPLTSSIGRLFDAVSSIIGLCDIIQYEGQAAIMLEKIAAINGEEYYPYKINRVDSKLPYTIDIGDMIKSILYDIKENVDTSVISGKFHMTISKMTRGVCEIIRDMRNINNIALSGGVFQNRLLLKLVIRELENSKFNVYIHRKVPTNDGGISLGQAAMGLRLLYNKQQR